MGAANDPADAAMKRISCDGCSICVKAPDANASPEGWWRIEQEVVQYDFCPKCIAWARHVLKLCGVFVPRQVGSPGTLPMPPKGKKLRVM
jgi:hypothetical protein